MSTFVTDRQRITRAVLLAIRNDYTESHFETALYRWWKNPRSSGGLRLTDDGANSFDQAEIEYHQFDAGDALYEGYMKFELMLDRRMPCPYYLIYQNKRKYIRVYDDRISTLISLHGDVVGFLNTMEERK